MEAIFPTAITSLIYEFSGVQQQWKNRFSNDMLPSINKGYRLVGMICSVHETDQHRITACDCVERDPCANCYSYGTRLCRHYCYDSVPYEDIKPHHMDLVRNPYIPYEHWNYFESKYFHIFDTVEYWHNQSAYQITTYSDVVIPLLEQIKTA